MVRYCKTCLMPDTRPRIEFDERGVCNGCCHAEEKKRIDWDARREEFLDLVGPFRSRDGSWDCVVPWSGGKDSSAIAYRLKFEFGLNPLLVTFSPLILNEVGMHNREELLKLGFDHVMVRPNQRVARRVARRFFIERGNLKVAWDAGVNAVPTQVAVRYGIPLVFYAEHGESEYGGRVLTSEHEKSRDLTEVLEHQIGDDPRNWVDDEIGRADLNPYLYPDPANLGEDGIKALYFAYFFRWSSYDNYNFIKDKIDFRTAPCGRTQGTFTNFDSLDDKTDDVYYYMQFIKFGFGRTIRDGSRMIQNGHLSRAQALEYARKYDGEFPEMHLPEILRYLDLSRDEFMYFVDLHRNQEIWEMRGNEWRLRHPVE